jgi:hypothetical protein
VWSHRGERSISRRGAGPRTPSELTEDPQSSGRGRWERRLALHRPETHGPEWRTAGRIGSRDSGDRDRRWRDRWARRPPSGTAPDEEFLAEFAGWDPRLVDLIRAAGTPGRWTLLDPPAAAMERRAHHAPRGCCASDVLVLRPTRAQAIEVAAVIAACLTQDLADPACGLQRYEALRPSSHESPAGGEPRALVRRPPPERPGQEARDTSFPDTDPWSRTAGSTSTTPVTGGGRMMRFVHDTRAQRLRFASS